MRDRNDNKPLVHFLKSQHAAIEQQLGAKPEWIEAKKEPRLVQRKRNADIDNEHRLATLFDSLSVRLNLTTWA